MTPGLGDITSGSGGIDSEFGGSDSDSGGSTDDSDSDPDPSPSGDDGSSSTDNNRVEGGLGDLDDDDFDDDGTIRDDVGGGSSQPSDPDRSSDTSDSPTDRDASTDQSGSTGNTSAGGDGTSGSTSNGSSDGGESWEESRVEGGLDDLDDSDFDDEGTVRDSVNEDGSSRAGSTEQGARRRDDLPEEVARAGRVPGGLSGIDFDESGTAVLEETPDEQGIETGEGSQAERARQLEDELVSDTNLDDEDVRVVQDYEGRLRARPTESYEQDIEQQAADESAITVAGYEADVERDFSAETEITDQGERQFREEVASQVGPVDDPQQVELARQDGQIRARPTEQARDAIAASVASQSSLIDRSEVRVGSNFGATLTQSAQQDLEAAYAEQYGVDQSEIDVTARGQLTEQSQGRVTQVQANRQYRQQGYYDPNSQQQAGEQEIIIGPNADYSEMEGVSTQQGPTRSTQAPGTAGRVTYDESPETVSPLAGMALEEGQIQQALEGEATLAQRANEGDIGAQVAMIGRGLQETGEGIRRGAVDAAEAAGLDAGPDVGDASVGEQVASFVGGTAGFPALLAGGAVQAAGAATQADAREGSFDRLQDTTTTAAESQAEFVQDRPVEAGLIAGTAVAMSPRARSAVRSGGERAASGVRSVTERARTRARNNRLISDERAMADLTGRSRSRSQSRSQSGEQSGQRSVPERDPVRRQATEGRQSGGRVVGDDGGVTVRGPARSMQRSQQYAQRVRTVSQMQGEGQIPSQLGDPAVIQPVQPADGSAAATAAAAGDLLTQAQQQQASVTDQQLRGQQSRTAGGTADAVTQPQQQRVQQAQRQEVSFDDAVAGTQERYFGVDAERSQTGVQDQQIRGESDAVQGSSVTPAENTPSVGDTDGVGGRPEGPRQDQPTDQQTGPGVGETPGERQGQGDQTVTTPDQPPGERVDTPPRLDLPPAQRTGQPGRPGPGPRQPPRPPRKPPRNPSLPRFGFSFGVGEGISGGRSGPSPAGGDSPLDTGWLNETVVDIATGGRGRAGAPSQQALANQPESLQLTGQLPTAAEVSGDQETQERIADVQSLLSFGVVGGDSGASSNGDDSGWPWLEDDEDGGGLL